MHDSDGMGVRGTAPAGCGAEPREENLPQFTAEFASFCRFRNELGSGFEARVSYVPRGRVARMSECRRPKRHGRPCQHLVQSDPRSCELRSRRRLHVPLDCVQADCLRSRQKMGTAWKARSKGRFNLLPRSARRGSKRPTPLGWRRQLPNAAIAAPVSFQRCSLRLLCPLACVHLG
jgi:hypothetical protein